MRTMKVVFGEADPRDFTPPEPASQQTPVPVSRPVSLRATLEIRLQRFPRRACESCGKRRVLFAIAVNFQPMSGYLCAPCAGTR
jgi:hypothetical protein